MSSSQSRLSDARKRLAQRDEAIRKKIETEVSRKRNSFQTSSQTTSRKVALKGTLAALKSTLPLKVPEKTTVGDAAQLCVAKRSDCFLVIDEREVTGIVTSKDLAFRVVAEGLDPYTTSVRQIMTPNPVIIDDSSTTTQALELMLTKRFRHLPIRSEDGNIFGILDISKIFHDALATAHRRSTASEQLFNAMAGIEAELGANESQSDMLAWAVKLRERTTLPDLAGIMGSTTHPVTVGPKASVREVAQIMKEKNTSAVCVMEEVISAFQSTTRRISRIAGIFTAKDILLRVLAPGLDAPRCSVIRVMTPQPDTAHPTTTIHDTVNKMYEGRFLHMPVIEDDGRLVAVVDIYSLAEATHVQIIAANQEVSAPDTVETIPNRFFEPTSRRGSPSFPADGKYHRPQSYANSGPSSSIDSPIPSTMSPSLDERIYVFKFIAPSGMAYRLKARQDDYRQVRELVTEKLQADPFFDINFYPDSSLCPDPEDLRISYEDEDGDTVMILSDHDVMDAVQVSQRAGKDRVVLRLHGGKSWAPIIAVDEGKPAELASRINLDKRNHHDVVHVLADTSIPNLNHIADLSPPEYTANDGWNVSDDIDVSAAGPSTGPTSYNSNHSLLDEAKADHFETFLAIHPTFDELEEAKHTILARRKDKQRAGLSMEQVLVEDWWLEHAKPTDDIRALVTRIGAVLDDVEQYKQLLSCTETDAIRLLDMSQTLLDVPGLSPKFRRNILAFTLRLSKRTGLHPTCYNLENVEMVNEYPLVAGHFADIYKGRFLGQVVCLKVLRIYQTSELHAFLKRFSAEAILWGQLSHLNVLPIYGLYRYSGRLSLVAPWMEYGDITQFLKEHPNENRGLFVLDVGSGLAYLHTHDIVHGDLKGTNILVNSSRRACLADFDLSSVTDSTILHWTSHSSVSSKGGSIRWQAPELFDFETEEIVQYTKASDVYAFSCAAYEIFTGDVPFFEHSRDSAVMLKVSSGEKPSRPHPSSFAWGSWGLTETTWSLMESCWSTDQNQRPSIYDVVSQHSSTVLVDDRSLNSEDIVLSPADFRDLVEGRAALPSADEIEEILTRGHTRANDK